MGSRFEKAPFYELLSPDPVDNIFNFCDAKSHSARRKLYAKSFTLINLQKGWESEIRDVVRGALDKIGQDIEKGEAEVMGWFTLMANEIVCRLTFGGGHCTVEKGIKDPFVLMLERRMGDLAQLRKHFVPPLFYLGPLPGKVLPRLHDIFYSPGDNVRRRRWGHSECAIREKPPRRRQKPLARALAENEAEHAGALTDTDIITDAGALLLAGSDPTAISLTFLLWCVLSHPDLQKEIEEEVKGISGNVTDEVCESLPLLNAVIDESLRLYGAAPGCMPRSPPVGEPTIGGYYIPDSAVVMTQNWSLQRSPDHWPNPGRLVQLLGVRILTILTAYSFDHTRWLPHSHISE
jgi:cytochrome P450